MPHNAAAHSAAPVTTLPPARRLLLIIVFNVLALMAALWVATSQPWLGLELKAAGIEEGAPGTAIIVGTSGAAREIPTGSVLVAIGASSGTALPVQGTDLMEEPDVLPGYGEYNAFMARQQELAVVLDSPSVTVTWRRGTNADQRADLAPGTHSTTIMPQLRPLSSLTLEFWFQIAVAMTGCLLAGWVWALNPANWGTRLFAITGLAFPVFAMSAAIYSSRELALPVALFRSLSAINHFGAALFGAALVALFMAYPRPLVRPRGLAAPFVFFLLWWLTDATQIAPDLDWGNRFLVMTEMLLAVVLGVVQWRRSHGNALERAALRWLLLSMLTGSGLFILSIVVTVALGWLPPLPQAYAFGFFLFIYVGIALGLARYRLFELDQWAWRMLVWVGGALAVLGLDAILITALDWSAATAFGTALWICGALYFPMRQWLWDRLTRTPRWPDDAVLGEVVRIAFAPSLQDQAALWDNLLRRLHDPLVLEPGSAPATPDTGHATIEEYGLALHVPAAGAIGPRRLLHARGGRRLFTPRDGTFIDALCQLMQRAQASRTAYEDGARAERKRIAQDMHDDVGARLLQLIHRAPTPDVAELSRAAMRDLRTAIATLDALPVPLDDALADWRAEAEARCEAAGVMLTWDETRIDAIVQIDAPRKAVLERVLREALTNALKHASPRAIAVTLTVHGNQARVAVYDDGPSSDPASWHDGHGLRAMRQRLSRDGGTLHIERAAQGGTVLMATLPLSGAAA